MANSATHSPKLMSDNIAMSSTTNQVLMDTNTSMARVDAELVKFDSHDDNGGLVAFSPSHHIPLFHLLAVWAG